LKLENIAQQTAKGLQNWESSFDITWSTLYMATWRLGA